MTGFRLAFYCRKQTDYLYSELANVATWRSELVTEDRVASPLWSKFLEKRLRGRSDVRPMLRRFRLFLLFVRVDFFWDVPCRLLLSLTVTGPLNSTLCRRRLKYICKEVSLWQKDQQQICYYHHIGEC